MTHGTREDFERRGAVARRRWSAVRRDSKALEDWMADRHRKKRNQIRERQVKGGAPAAGAFADRFKAVSENEPGLNLREIMEAINGEPS